MQQCLTLDTNTIVSALLWRGSPRKLMDAVRANVVDGAASPALPAELTVAQALAMIASVA